MQFPKLFYKIMHSRSENVAISAIISEVTEVSTKEGWGGKHIEYFPPHKFYRIYMVGSKTEAKKSMEKWYYNRFIKDGLCIVPKKRGGMLNGSLFRTLAGIHKRNGIKLKDDLSNGECALVAQGIRERVEDRFKLIESIIEHGYQNTARPVCLRREGVVCVIVDGHHRVAAMSACDYSTIPCNTKSNIFSRLTKTSYRRKLLADGKLWMDRIGSNQGSRLE